MVRYNVHSLTYIAQKQAHPAFAAAHAGALAASMTLWVGWLDYIQPALVHRVTYICRQKERTQHVCVCALSIKCTLLTPNLSYNFLTSLSERACPGGAKIGGRKNPSESPQKHNTTTANSHVFISYVLTFKKKKSVSCPLKQSTVCEACRSLTNPRSQIEGRNLTLSF
jgi:hypothetical protein